MDINDMLYELPFEEKTPLFVKLKIKQKQNKIII